MDKVTKEKIEKYFSVTGEALTKAKSAPENLNITDLTRADFLDMAQRYFEDAKHFQEKGEIVNAFAALNYAHGWLDAGARIGLFDVGDSRLFTVDDKPVLNDEKKE
ncbi:MAG: DUF357 domain-containing protein [Candidatus Nanoarchaeia archaeon]|nr:DUF357 domain-containing protein [Candidatus Nanoarchaeia archaeon]